jgi:hypothetical protein
MSKTVIVIHPDYAAAKDYAARLTRDWCWAPDPHAAANWLERIETDYGVAIDPFWVVLEQR